jgi:hypothetical protein
MVGIAGVTLLGLLWGATAPAADAPGAKLVPLEVKLPKPLFQGTPKNIPQSPTLEKYNEKPRSPLLAPEGTVNLALHKKVTSSDPQPVIGELTMITDGDKEGDDGSFVEIAPEKQWVQIDLGAAADIYAIALWHYHGEARVYHGVVIQASDDANFTQNVKTIFNNDFANALGLGAGKQLEYIEDFRGKVIDARDASGQPAHGRYVRLYSKGNTSNDLNHYVEVEVYGKTAP